MPTVSGCLIFLFFMETAWPSNLAFVDLFTSYKVIRNVSTIKYTTTIIKYNIFQIVEPKCELVLCPCAQRSLEKCVVWRGSWLFITFVEDCSCRAISFPERWTGPLRESHRRWSTLSGKDNSEMALTFSTAARMSALGFTELTMRKALSDC